MDERAREKVQSVLHALPGHLLWRAQARVANEVADSLPGRSDLYAYAALVGLAIEEPQSQQGLARMCGVSGTTMTAVAETLQAEGLVERVRNPEDRRSYSLTRTTAGRSAVRRWAPHVRQLEARLTAGLSPGEVARLQEILTRLIGNHLDERTPPALRRSTGFLLSRAHQRVHKEFLTGLSPLGIEPRHYGTLRALLAGGPMTQGDLGQLLDVSPATVVQLVDHLEKQELLLRERDAVDRRAYRLRLQPRAEDVVTQASKVAGRVLDDRLDTPQGHDRDDLVALLRTFVTAPSPR
jgi:DNA-binding MarR family transcriptional regulator